MSSAPSINCSQYYCPINYEPTDDVENILCANGVDGVCDTKLCCDGIDVGSFVWVLLGFYMAFLLGIAAWSFRRRMNQKAISVNESMADHYLGNSEFRGVMLALTTFATTFSGYTVAGVPGEMFFYGFFSFRWLFCIGGNGLAISLIGSRLQYLTARRGYISPTDFIKDRHNSHSLQILVSLCLAFPAMVYVLAQFKTMGDTIEGLSNGDITSMTAATVLCVIMLAYELFGGLRAIIWTDAVQGAILLTGFVIFYGVQEDTYGGAKEAGEYIKLWGGANLLSNDMMAMWFAFQIPMVFGFAFYPHLIQRYQAAHSQWDFKAASIFLVFGSWLAMTSSLITGMVAVNYFGRGHPDLQNPADQTLIFGQIMRNTISISTFGNLLGSIMITSSVAAFMSTADSALNGFSACLTLDCVKPFPHYLKFWSDDKKEWKPMELEIIGKLVSLIGAIIALSQSDTDIEMGALLTLQNGILMQVLPSYVFGFFDTMDLFTPLGYLLGCLTGSITYILIQCVGVEECVQSDPGWYAPIPDLQPAVFAFLLNLSILFTVSLMEAQMGSLQPSFDVIIPHHHMPLKFLGLNLTTNGKPSKEGKASKPWDWPYWPLMVLVLFFSYFAIPWYRNRDDWGTSEDMFGGLPRYIRDGFIFAGLTGIFNLALFIFLWDTSEDEEDLSQYASAIEAFRNSKIVRNYEVEAGSQTEMEASASTQDKESTV